MWLEGIKEEKPKAVLDEIKKVEKIWAHTSLDVREKWMSLESPFQIERHKKAGGFDGDLSVDADEFSERLKFMKHEYYLEDRSSDEGILCGVAGFDDEEKALDHLFEAGSKYGSWCLWKWDHEKKQWLEAKVKRQGKDIKVLWEVESP